MSIVKDEPRTPPRSAQRLPFKPQGYSNGGDQYIPNNEQLQVEKAANFLPPNFVFPPPFPSESFCTPQPHQHCFTPDDMKRWPIRPQTVAQPAQPLIPASEVKAEREEPVEEVPEEAPKPVEVQSSEKNSGDKENIKTPVKKKRKAASPKVKEPKKPRESKPKPPIIPLHPTVFTYSLDGQLAKTSEGQKIMQLLREGGWPGAASLKVLCSLICDPILDFCAKRFYPTRRELREYLAHLFRGFTQANIDIMVGNANDKGFMEKAVYNRRRIRRNAEATPALPPPP